MTDTDTILNKRQDTILHYFGEQRLASVSQILAQVQKKFAGISKITINRDLKKLVEFGLLVKTGSGRGVTYALSSQYRLIQPVNVENYFKIETDERIIHEQFNFDIFSHLHHLFSENELTQLQQIQHIYTKKIRQLPSDALKKEFERLTIELSWKSSKIEGNTYSLLETEQLIRERKESSGHSKEEAVMILNHKKALDYIRTHRKQFQTISRRKIEDIHTLLVSDLPISRNVRKSIVRITGTRYTPLDNIWQINEALDTMCQVVNKGKNPLAKTLVLMTLIAYIQPFIDGNKRTSRLMGNAVLLAHDYCPLSFRSINEIEYKKALLLFYEQQNLWYFKKLFMQQFEFAVHNYFG